MAKAKNKTPPRIAPNVSPQDAKALLADLDHLIVNYEGDFDELRNAIGTYIIGRLVGWRVIVLIHNKRTIKKYEDVFDKGGMPIDFRKAFPEYTEFSEKSLALRIVKKLGNFWKAVNGEYSDPELKEDRRKLA